MLPRLDRRRCQDGHRPDSEPGWAAADIPQADTGEALGFPPARLTITFGFGPGCSLKDGKTVMASPRTVPTRSSICPDSTAISSWTRTPAVIYRYRRAPTIRRSHSMLFASWHSPRTHVAQLRWAQTGFIANPAAKETQRNLMGFKDGTSNPSVTDPNAMGKFVWVSGEGPDWMRGGSYMVVRRIRMALEHWDRMTLAFSATDNRPPQILRRSARQQTRIRLPPTSPLADKDGNPVIPENSHVRLAVPGTNDGARILRRPYSYNDGVNFNAERWPPWRQGMEYDAGLLSSATSKTRGPGSSRSSTRCRSSIC